MFNINGKREDFRKRYDKHVLYVSTANVFFQNIRLLNTMKNIPITRDEFNEFYLGILDDIKVESSPAKTIIPNDTELPEDENGDLIVPEDYQLFVFNRGVPEYQKISARIKADDMDKTLPLDHRIRMSIKDAPERIDKLIDGIFVHWLIHKYLDQIEQVHIAMLQNFVPVVSYVIENINEKTLKNFIFSKRIGQKKVVKWSKEFVFRPDMSRLDEFYKGDHNGFPKIDVKNLMERLISNLVVETDIYIIAAIYLMLSFAMVDIHSNKVEESETAQYVRDVLSKI